jgi:phosphate transport system substrate-binding protein
MRALLMFGFLTLALSIGIGCGNGSNGTHTDGGGHAGEPVVLKAGGATFVDPIMQKWSTMYKDAKNVKVDYVAGGSGAGIRDVTKKLLAFGCSDAPMDEKEVKAAKEGGEVLHIPVAIGAVALIYHLEGVKDLKLTGEVVADIYTRKILSWNDDRITKLNPGVPLPNQPIVPVARDASSGTSNIFTEYLSKRSASFKEKPGASKSPKWPEGVEKKKENAGIAEAVKSTPNTIGYVELAFAKNNQLPYAWIINKAGKPVAPDAPSVTAAVDHAMKVKEPKVPPYSLHPLTFSFTDADGEHAYPIVGASYAMFYKKQPKDVGPAIVEFLKWVVTDGQKISAEMHYAPLPGELAAKCQELLGTVTSE